MPSSFVVCFDLGRNSGVAEYDLNTKQCNSFEKNFVSKDKGQLFKNFSIFLDEMLTKKDVKVVFFEKICSHKGTIAAHMYGGFEAFLLMKCCEHSIPCIGLHVSTIRMIVTGSGKSKKEDVRQSLEKIGYMFTAKDHNAMDAMAVLLCAQKKYLEFFK